MWMKLFRREGLSLERCLLGSKDVQTILKDVKGTTVHAVQPTYAMADGEW